MDLVTGASGFLGGHLVDRLVADGASVRALVRPSSNATRLEKLGIQFAVGSFEDAASLDRAMRGVSRVFHCAAMVADFGSWDTFKATNVTGVEALLRSAEKAGVKRFIHVSTSDVYGHPNVPVDETAPLRKRGWPYGDTKIESEKIVWKAYHESAIPITVVRPVSIYGPRSPSIVLEVVDLLKRGQMMHIGGGHAIAGLAYVANVVDLLLLAAESQAAVGQAYNASDGTLHTWRDYVDRLADIVDVRRPTMNIRRPAAYAAGWAMEKCWAMFQPRRRPLLTRMAVEIFGTNQGFSIEKARTQLGYSPSVDFDEGMRKVGQWLRESGVL